MAKKLTAFSTAGSNVAGGGYYHLPITDIVITKRDGQKVKTVQVVKADGSDEDLIELSYITTKVIGKGTFGVVQQIKLVDTGEVYAVKWVRQDRKFKNRELQIMRHLSHTNITQLRYFFCTLDKNKDTVYLNLVMEYIPETVHRVILHYSRNKHTFPLFFIKLYMYQILRGLAYIHMLGISHRDIKPQNLLCDPDRCIVKVCDFGSAKYMIKGEPNVAYICSRYYRAPELILGATEYTTMVDVWSAGCVLAEFFIARPVFPGDSNLDQFSEIMRILGTPTEEQVLEMNPNWTECRFPKRKAVAWEKVLEGKGTPSAIDLTVRLLDYVPAKRMTCFDGMTHVFFDDLRKPGITLPDGGPLPQLFNFSHEELQVNPSINHLLRPH
ncbi:glycogen synthase kinase-3 beta-like [Ixodes scapularis]|uniref:glycogen synthase kinase-3 beta-like n=1 Tax=Ixodes scapularis TaxID=6945 RepID=UPI001C38A5ED|nr:glycogen synthase kinase-3 beta-like [Ixodes scapularis]